MLQETNRMNVLRSFVTATSLALTSCFAPPPAQNLSPAAEARLQRTRDRYTEQDARTRIAYQHRRTTAPERMQRKLFDQTERDLTRNLLREFKLPPVRYYR